MNGATRVADVDPEHLRQLNSGQVQSRTLAEALAMDHTQLLQTTISNVPAELCQVAADTQHLGILKRMQAIGAALHQHLPGQACQELAHHPSDTVRGWACFAAAADPRNEDPELLLVQIRSSADDAHFAVREWVWMAARPLLGADVPHSIELLLDWTVSDSERIRRFASEALRPRGVWARHIAELKQNPSLGVPLLEPLRADTSRYVQDSVANWINDAAKTNPDWALQLCHRWNKESPTPETSRIITKALRSLGTRSSLVDTDV